MADLKITAAIYSRLNLVLNSKKDEVAKTAIKEGEKEFIKSLNEDLEDLQAKKEILVQMKKEHVFEPAQSVILELKQNLKKAERALRDKFEELTSNAVENLVQQAQTGHVSKDSFRVLYRLSEKDTSISKVLAEVSAVEAAKKRLEAAGTDEKMKAIDKQIEEVEEQMATIKKMIKG